MRSPFPACCWPRARACVWAGALTDSCAPACSLHGQNAGQYRYEDYGNALDHEHYLDKAQHGAWGADRARDHFPWGAEDFFQAPQVTPACLLTCWGRLGRAKCTKPQAPTADLPWAPCCPARAHDWRRVRQARSGNYLWLDPHILCTPALADMDGDGQDDLVVAASYFFDRDQYDTPVRRPAGTRMVPPASSSSQAVALVPSCVPLPLRGRS